MAETSQNHGPPIVSVREQFQIVCSHCPPPMFGWYADSRVEAKEKAEAHAQRHREQPYCKCSTIDDPPMFFDGEPEPDESTWLGKGHRHCRCHVCCTCGCLTRTPDPGPVGAPDV